METKKIICPFCGSEMNVQPSKDYVYHICECSTCGHYVQKVYTAKEVSPYAKYLKPHFDVAQKQTLVWDDHNDLTKKLSEWIKAIIG